MLQTSDYISRNLKSIKMKTKNLKRNLLIVMSVALMVFLASAKMAPSTKQLKKQTVHHSLAVVKTSVLNTKCGDGKCGDGKSAENKKNLKSNPKTKHDEGKCGDGKAKDAKKMNEEKKCGDGKCGDGKAKEVKKPESKENKCGTGKCGKA